MECPGFVLVQKDFTEGDGNGPRDAVGSQTFLDQGPWGSSQLLCKALPSCGTRRGLNFLVKEVYVRREERRAATGLAGLGVEGTAGR